MTLRFFPSLLVLVAATTAAAAHAAPAAGGPSAKVAPVPTFGTVSLTCNAFYLPARSIWRRVVEIAYDTDGVQAVSIDGVAVYSFAVTDTTVLTAVDGERIQIDTATRTWSSDLRGLVSSNGTCTLAN